MITLQQWNLAVYLAKVKPCQATYSAHKTEQLFLFADELIRSLQAEIQELEQGIQDCIDELESEQRREGAPDELYEMGTHAQCIECIGQA